MISETMQLRLNEQINNEFGASYYYLSLAAHYEDESLQGFAHWMRVQSAEEYRHALRIFDYALDQRGKVMLESVEKPQARFDSPLSTAQEILAHERDVTH